MKSLKGYINIRKKQTTVVAKDDTIIDICTEALVNLGGDADLNFIDTSKCTSLKNLFYGMFAVHIFDINPDVSKWDVHNVKNFESCFSFSSFNGDLSEWDMSSAENLCSMFNNAKKYEGIGLDDWQDSLSKVNDTSWMFRGTAITGKTIEAWKFSNKLRNVYHMFDECENLNCDLSKWDLTNMSDPIAYKGMLFECTKFKKEHDPAVRIPYYLRV